MAFNRKILGRANARLASIRDANEAEHKQRLIDIYARIPEIQDIDYALTAQMSELAKLFISGKAQAGISELREKNLDLQMRKAELLTEKGYPSDWLDEIYSCPDCHDTGYLKHGKVCSCLLKLYNKELTDELSTLLKNGDESFDNFDPGLYPGEYSEYYSCVPREYMKKVAELCKEFADSFPNVTSGLLLSGGPGLGKTYLSACIARTVAGNGYSVCYESAVEAFKAFEQEQFARDPEDREKASEKVRQMISCDLFILDDLGTEVLTPVVQSALYTLINTRENNGKYMIISTTCSSTDLDDRYTPSICSRLDGFFQKLQFAGNDIRSVLRGRR